MLVQPFFLQNTLLGIFQLLMLFLGNFAFFFVSGAHAYPYI